MSGNQKANTPISSFTWYIGYKDADTPLVSLISRLTDEEDPVLSCIKRRFILQKRPQIRTRSTLGFKKQSESLDFEISQTTEEGNNKNSPHEMACALFRHISTDLNIPIIKLLANTIASKTVTLRIWEELLADSVNQAIPSFNLSFTDKHPPSISFEINSTDPNITEAIKLITIKASKYFETSLSDGKGTIKSKVPIEPAIFLQRVGQFLEQFGVITSGKIRRKAPQNPSASDNHEVLRVAIVGGGASGIMAIRHLMDRMDMPKVEILHIETNSAKNGGGIAYKLAADRSYASRFVSHMSANANGGRSDLLEWLLTANRSDWPEEEQGQQFSNGSTIRRLFLGHYMDSKLDEIIDFAQEAKIGTYKRKIGTVVDVIEDENGATVIFENGEQQKLDMVILATGHGKTIDHHAFRNIKDDDHYIGEVWENTEKIFNEIPKDEDIVIVGGSLTSAEIARLVAGQEDRNGRITIISRGRPFPDPYTAEDLPQVYKKKFDKDEFKDLPTSLEGVVEMAARVVDKYHNQRDWKHWEIIYSLRPVIKDLLKTLDPDVVKDLHREYRSVINKYSTLIPKPMWQELMGHMLNDRIVYIPGRVRDSSRSGEKISLEYTLDDGTKSYIATDWCISAVGLNHDYSISAPAPFAEMIKRGTASPHKITNLGIDTDDQCRVTKPDGTSHRRIIAVGVPQIGFSIENYGTLGPFSTTLLHSGKLVRRGVDYVIGELKELATASHRILPDERKTFVERTQPENKERER